MTPSTSKPRDDWSFLFFGLFILVLLGSFLSNKLKHEVCANYFYDEGKCVVVDKRVFEDPYGGGGTYRPEFLIRYTVNGREYEVWAYDALVGHASAWRWPKELALERFEIGQEYPCWYEPADPSHVVVVRGYSWGTYVSFIAFLAVTALIGVGVVRRRRKASKEAPQVS